MKEKKEKPTALVLIVIWFLLLMIALPPIFRVVFKEEEKVQNREVEQIEVLICSINTIDGYQIESKSKYINGSPSSNTITFKQNTALVPLSLQQSLTELNYFNAIPTIEKITSDTEVIVELDADIISENAMYSELSNYLLEKENQQMFYKNNGYSCYELKS